MNGWSLAQVRPGADHIAKRNLELFGVVTSQPPERRTIGRRSRFIKQHRPFFSAYLFVSYRSLSAPLSIVESTYGVPPFVRFGERPAVVPASVLSELRAACDPADVIVTSPLVAFGDIVEVTSVAITNLLGYVERFFAEATGYVIARRFSKERPGVIAFAKPSSGGK
jgi:transcriptional antiterminator RfaH